MGTYWKTIGFAGFRREPGKCRASGPVSRVVESLSASVLLVASLPSISAGDAFIEPEAAGEHPGFAVQGEYTGWIEFEGERREAGLQVAADGDHAFRGRLYFGGLPGAEGSPVAGDDGIALRGGRDDGVVTLEGDGSPRFRHIRNRFAAVGAENVYLGHLERVHRESPTLGLEPPEGAIVLFDGSGLEHWSDSARTDGGGLLMEGATTAEEYGDKRLHVEAKLGFIPGAEGQQRANSGIYIQNRYEVQILDSFALPPAVNGNASLYNVSAPRVNATFPPATWQTYDVFFRAPRFDEDGSKTENARVTAYLNGVLVHDDAELSGGTGAGGQREEVSRGPLYLQDHGDPVRFRNVWLLEEEYDPPGTERLVPQDG